MLKGFFEPLVFILGLEMNLYETLGVGLTATHSEIKKAYKKAASANHPDKEGGCPNKMAGINLAYEVLSDPEKRDRYNRTGETAKKPELIDQVISIITQRLCAIMEGNNYEPANYFNKLMTEMEGNIQQCKSATIQLETAIRKLGYLIDNCVIKNEVMKAGLQLQLTSMKMKLEKLHEQEPVFNLSRKVLEECEYTGELPQRYVTSFTTSATSF